MSFAAMPSWNKISEMLVSSGKQLNSAIAFASEHPSFSLLVGLLKVVFGVVLFLGMISLPRVAVDATHDLGSVFSFEVYHSLGTKFGTEVIQNIGPYGFLTFPFSYSGLYPIEKIIYNFSFTVIFICMVLWTISRFEGLIFRVAFVLTLSYFFFQPETSTYILFLMVACLVMSSPSGSTAVILKAAVVPVLAFLALTKAIFLFCSLFLIGLGCTRFSLSRRHDIAAILVLTYVACLALLWFAAGQGAGNFVQFVINATKFSSIYNDAMTVQESLNLTLIGASAVLAIGVRLLVLLFTGLRRGDVEAACVALFFGLVTFLAWKHGFVRADGHMYLFFFYGAAASPLLLLASFDCERGERWTWLSVRVLLCAWVIAAGLLGVEGIGGAPNDIIRLAQRNIRLLQSFPDDLRGLEQQFQANKAADRLNGVKQMVGLDTIDNFGMLPGIVLMNDLNYRGRPMPIRFMALGNLERQNAEFYRDPARAPRYVLMSDGALDNRLLAQDDAQTFLELITKYQVVLIENGNILFKRRVNQGGDIHFWPLSHHNARFGEPIPIPQDKGRYVWACVDIRSSQAGMLYRMLYKSPDIFIRLFAGDKERSGWPKVNKFIPVSGGSCFLVTPLIASNWEFVLKNASDLDSKAAPGQSAGLLDPIEPATMQFVINHRHGDIFFKKELTVKFFGITGIPNQSIPSDRVAQRLFTFDRFPIRVEAADFRPLAAYGRPAVLVHAPARIDFNKPTGVGRVTADFGMLPSSFENGAGGDGIALSVTFTSAAGGEARTLFERTLDPVKLEGDRGIQKLAVELPRDEAGTVAIIIGARANNAWDHSFLANVAFTP
jgi:hypothetical protein